MVSITISGSISVPSSGSFENKENIGSRMGHANKLFWFADHFKYLSAPWSTKSRELPVVRGADFGNHWIRLIRYVHWSNNKASMTSRWPPKKVSHTRRNWSRHLLFLCNRYKNLLIAISIQGARNIYEIDILNISIPESVTSW